MRKTLLWMVVVGTEKGAAIKGCFRRVRSALSLARGWGLKDLKDTEGT